MLRSRKSRLAAAVAAAAMSLSVAAPASAQTQEGLVNVNVELQNIQVLAQVPIGVAANVCGVNAAVLAQGDQATDPVCDADADAFTRGQQRAFGIQQ